MPIFTAIGTAIAGALFGGSLFAANLIGAGLLFGAKLAVSYLTRPKARKYSAVQGEIQYGADVPVGVMFGTGMVKGHRAYYAKYGKGNKFNSDVYLLANGWCDGLEGLFFYGEAQTLVPVAVIGGETARYETTKFGNNLTIRFYDGRPGQTVDAKLVADTAALGTEWKSTSVCAGLCYVVIDREYDSRFVNGTPEFSFVLRGLRCYDPRKDSTVAGGSGAHRITNPATWQFTKNPAVQRLNYQLGIKGLISQRTLIGEGKSLGQLDLSSYFVAMNVSDTIRAGKPTYQSAIYVQATDDHTEILKEFDDAMAGFGVNRRGLSGIIPGAPQIPVLEITSDDIPLDRAQVVNKRPSSFDMYNMMSGQFTSPESQWQPESLDPIVVNADITADKRPRQTANDFLQVSDPDIAQYLLNIRYRQNRKGGTATVPVSRRVGLKVQEGEWVTFDGMTWMVQEWRCDEQFQFTLELTETGSDIYADGDIEPGPVIIPSPPPVNPSLLSTVQNFHAETGMINGATGFEQPALHFTWDPPADPTITEVRFFYRIVGTTREFEDKCTNPEVGFFDTSKDVQSGIFYECKATITTVPDRFKTYTPWVTTSTVTGFFNAFSPGQVDAVLARLDAKLKWIEESTHYARDVVEQADQLAAEAGAQSVFDKRELLAEVGNTSARFTEQVKVVVTQTSALVVQVSQLTAQINDPDTGLAAIGEITNTNSVSITTIDGELTVVTNTVNANTVSIGKFSANGLFRSEQVTTQAGAQSTIGISVSATGGGATSQAVMFLSAIAGGLSEIGFTADSVYMVAPGAKRRPFIFSGGTLFLDDVRINSLFAITSVLGAVDISSAVIGSLIVGTSNLGIDSVSSFDVGPTTDIQAGGSFADRTINMPAANRSLMQLTVDLTYNYGTNGGSPTVTVQNITTGEIVFQKSFGPYGGSSNNRIIDQFFFFGNNAAGNNTFRISQTPGQTTGLNQTRNVTLRSLFWKR